VADVHDSATRSRNMAAIRNRDTKPELLIRRALHQKGFRYTLNNAGLPGKPDLVFKRFKAVLFVHGCFWHQHECHLFKWPASRQDFWRDKISKNRRNDQKACQRLQTQGWRVCTVWECSLRGKQRKKIADIVDEIGEWLLSSEESLIIGGDVRD